SQVPVPEREVWNPPFEAVMASLQITRDDELFLRQLTNEVLVILRERHPDQDFQLDEKGIRGKNRVVFMSNLHREVKANPARRAQTIQHFVDSLAHSAEMPMGQEPWEETRPLIVPVVKPPTYIDPDGPHQHRLTQTWLR